jgi:hypothetical protein
MLRSGDGFLSNGSQVLLEQHCRWQRRSQRNKLPGAGVQDYVSLAVVFALMESTSAAGTLCYCYRHNSLSASHETRTTYSIAESFWRAYPFC